MKYTKLITYNYDSINTQFIRKNDNGSETNLIVSTIGNSVNYAIKIFPSSNFSMNQDLLIESNEEEFYNAEWLVKHLNDD